ncbi:MAG: TRAP transporter small permease [Spirochaetes bacterium]|nr:TRAP transporter small permease [Spirochaetota bacterium]
MKSKILITIDLWIERINQVFVISAGFMVVIMAFISTYGAIRRYVFRSPDPVSYEFGCIFLLVSFVLAIAAVERQDRLLRADFFLDKFSDNIRNIISNIVSPVLGIVFFGMISWISFGDAMYAFKIGQLSRSSWPVPLFPVKIFIPIGYGFLCLVLLFRFTVGMANIKTPRKEQETVSNV